MKVIENRDYSRLIGAATQRIPSDLTIKNVKLVNVLTGEIYPASVDVKDGVIVHVQPGECCDSISEKVYDGQGRYLLPGYIEVHMHVESSMLTPENFGREAILHGTTTALVDPHEIGNVSGIPGMQYMIDDAKKSPVRQINLAPSCVPADSEFETVPFPVRAPEMSRILDMEGMYGIAEVMDSNAVIQDKEFMRDILHEGRRRNLPIQGHCFGATGRGLSAYRLAGVINTHTVLTGDEVREYMRAGMHANMQSSSLSTMFGLKEMITGIEGMKYMDFLSVCTDDVHAKDMQQNGHINAILKQLLALGVDSMDAIRYCTYNPARETGFEDLGAIAPGFVADMQLVDELDGRNPSAVFVAGQQMVEDGKVIVPASEPSAEIPFSTTVNIKEITAEDCRMTVPFDRAEFPVVDCSAGRFGFKEVWRELPVKDGYADISSREDCCYVAVFNRFGLGTKCIAVYSGFGLKQGAMATTIAHDCHNIVVAYKDPADAALAINRLRETGGGIVAVKDHRIHGEVQLPVAGLMSVKPCSELVAELDVLAEQIKEIWTEENPSLLKLSLLALTVVGGIAITDTSLVDGNKRVKVPAFRRIEA